MKRIHLIRILIGLSLIFAIKLHAQVEDPVAPPAMEVVAKAQPVRPLPAAEPVDKSSPVVVPALDHYARLWTESLFTTRALPPPEAPAGPNFTDNLSLSGTYEENGKLTAILIDKTTSNVVLAYIGEDNPEGIRIVKVTPGATPDQMKLQLQKGALFGWVTFNTESDAPPAGGAGGLAPNGPLGTRNTVPSPPPGRMGNPNVPQQRNAQMMPPQQAPPSPAIPQPAAPSLRGGMPQAPPAVPGDIPLPPP